MDMDILNTSFTEQQTIWKFLWEFIPVLSSLVDVGFDSSLIMAHPIKFGENPKWEGRGQSIFDKKTDDFDALDEAWSQWMDALRKGRSKEWIPESLLPRDPESGAIIKPKHLIIHT